MLDRVISWSALFLVVVSPVVLIVSLITGEWWSAAMFSILTVYGVREVRNERRRRQAMAAWPPERVQALIGEMDDPVAAARKMREVDPRLDIWNSMELATRKQT